MRSGEGGGTGEANGDTEPAFDSDPPRSLTFDSDPAFDSEPRSLALDAESWSVTFEPEPRVHSLTFERCDVGRNAFAARGVGDLIQERVLY